MGFYAKLDSKGNNPKGFVENFKLPEVVQQEAKTDPGYKVMME